MKKTIFIFIMIIRAAAATELDNKAIEDYYKSIKNWTQNISIDTVWSGKYSSKDDKHVVRVEPGRYKKDGEISYNFWDLDSRVQLIHRVRNQQCNFIKENNKRIGMICRKGLGRMNLIRKYGEIYNIWIIVFDKDNTASIANIRHYTKSKSFKTLKTIENLKRDW